MARLADWLRDVLTAGAARTWRATAPVLEAGLVLDGDAALTARLRHRTCAELDFVDMSATPLLREPTWIEGLPVVSLDDLMVSRLDGLLRHGAGVIELFDLMVIEEQAGLPVEEGLTLYPNRFGGDRAVLEAITARLGDAIAGLQGAASGHDSALMLPRASAEIAAYWRDRQPEITASLATRGYVARRRRDVVGGVVQALRPQAAVVYVAPHQRDGQQVEGYWRRR
jgi:hypothetical protein